MEPKPMQTSSLKIGLDIDNESEYDNGMKQMKAKISESFFDE